MAPSIPRGVSWHPAPLPHPSGRCRRRRRGKEPHRLAVARFLCGRAARSGSAGTRCSCHGGCCCPFLGLRGTGATLLAWEHPGPGAELLGSPRSLLGLWGLAHGTRTASGSGPRMSGATDCLCHRAQNQVCGVQQPYWEADSCNTLLHSGWGAADGGESTSQ